MPFAVNPHGLVVNIPTSLEIREKMAALPHIPPVEEDDGKGGKRIVKGQRGWRLPTKEDMDAYYAQMKADQAARAQNVAEMAQANMPTVIIQQVQSAPIPSVVATPGAKGK